MVRFILSPIQKTMLQITIKSIPVLLLWFFSLCLFDFLAQFFWRILQSPMPFRNPKDESFSIARGLTRGVIYHLLER